MPEQLPAHLLDLERRAHAFASDVLLPLAAETGNTSADARARVVQRSKAAGFFGMTQPREYGGTQAGILALVVARDTLASHNPRFLPDVFGPGPGVLANAAEPLRGSHLLPLMEGQKRAGFAFTEPRDASHYTRAVRDGDVLVVTGRKSYVTRGAEVDFLNVLLDVGDEGRAFVVIDTDAPGVIKERLFDTIDGTHHAAFRFDSARVPVSHLCGQPGDGMTRAMGQIGRARMTMAAEAVGLSRWVIDFLTDRLRDMEGAGGARESVRLRYGELRIKAYAARATVYRAARRVESGENAVNEAIAAKAFATETLGEIIDGAMQLTGGGALLTDHPLAVLYREARVLRVSEGLTDVLRLNIARGALELGKGTL